jgi:hypothetical protein
MEDRTRVDHATRAVFGERGESQDIAITLQTRVAVLPDSFVDLFDVLRPTLVEIAARCDDVLRSFGTEEFKEAVRVLEPPQYIVMWDIRGSTETESRDDIEPVIALANQRVLTTVGDRVMDFRPESRDDGNGLICSHFSDVAAVFQILLETFHERVFRCGCNVNLEGRLNYYPEKKALGGRAYEYAARISALFKEIRAHDDVWDGGRRPEEPAASYLVLGEFARRFAEQERAWPPEGFVVRDLPGLYRPRVHASIPISVCLVLAAGLSEAAHDLGG